MASKLCDSCKSAASTVFCRADTAFLCLNCDAEIHAANKLASRHARVLVCEVCEQAPAHVTCKADAAALCVTCDRDIHSANPLARRHERIPVTPFYEAAALPQPPAANFLPVPEEEEAEAASWLLPNPNNNNNNNHKVALEEVDPYLDLEYYVKEEEEEEELEEEEEEGDVVDQEQNSSRSDGVVPVRNKLAVINQQACYDFDFSGVGVGVGVVASKPLFPSYAFNPTPCFSNTDGLQVSSSSVEVGVVPDGGGGGGGSSSTSMMADIISNPYNCYHHQSTNQTVPLSRVDREARVMRYREKRKNRKFEKTIRYASRKAYAETRPRIKGRFAKRTDDTDTACLDADVLDPATALFGFGVVPSFSN